MDNRQSLSTSLLRLSTDKQQLLLFITPLKDEINLAKLSHLVQTSEYHYLKLNSEGLKEAVQAFQRLETEKDRASELHSVAIADRLDAQLSISFDPLKMNAKAQVISAYGGNSLSMEELQAEMLSLEISHGINESALSLLLEKSKTAIPGTTYQVTIAKGTQPVNGVDADFKRLVETPKERLLKPQKQADGRVDMHDLGKLITVKIGSELMRKIPYSEGTPGKTVTGEVIDYKPGNDFALEAGENCKVSDSDQNLLVATLAGIPKTINHGMEVDDVLLINNVDIGYGNVDYEGSIIIEGDICDGMKVHSTGDITVSGFIESANIECGGDLIVGKGIIGHKIDDNAEHFSCEIKSKGSVVASFSQYSKMEIGQDLTIKKQLLHCHISCQGNISVQDDSASKGTIVGGYLRTAKGINTVTLGANAGTKTIIDLVGEYPKLMETKKQLNLAVLEEQKKLDELMIAQQKVDALPNSEKKQHFEARLMLTKETVKKQLTVLNNELESNKAGLQLYFENAKVITQKEMFNDVSVAIGRDNFSSNRKYGPTKINVSNYKILANPYQK